MSSAMEDLGGTVLTAAGAFAATNLDDLLVLSVLFLSARTRTLPRLWRIWVGQYIGIGILTVVAAAAALALTPVPVEWVGFLGLVPLALGCYALLKVARPSGHPPKPRSLNVPVVVAVTVANGGDNISVYIPLFRSLGPAASATTGLTFAVMVAVWCAAGFWLTAHPKVGELCRRAGNRVIPVVYIALGITIIVRSGVIALLVQP
ncbi:cadmium resistance transporter [Arthrobacter sp. SRS-W-1-2016]|uniref:cadmium resistance transporter n=1 Tax=Arthrobacter sp. SRS-W-1-2016 TaxID=1930254 RepID=UPI001C0B46F9|nr:cadmium resistance transporter [Arthrobacter sp. SRS-W-1-2016]